MAGETKSWDDIPSLGLQMDGDYDNKLKATEDHRRDHRAAIESLKDLLPENIAALPVRVATAAKGVFNGEILDLSASGLRVSVPKLLEAGEPAKVGFILNKKTISSNAITKWIKPNGEGCLAGMEFQNLSQDFADFLGGIGSADLFKKLGK